MHFCFACGGRVNADARFCPSCGAPRAAKCSACGASTRPTDRFCSTCGTELKQAPAEQDERKLVTVVFADLTGSTELGERLDPERVGMILERYFTTMASVIERWGGTVQKYIGDAIVAVFGTPRTREDDAVRALRASLEMLERLGPLNGELERAHGVILQVRIGVNTGEVVAPGGERVRETIVLGDAVNVAARLQGAAAPGTVLAGGRTWRAARHAFRFSDPDTLSLKGKAAGVIARRVEQPILEPPRAVDAPLIGRTAELQGLVGAFDEARAAGNPRSAVVLGDAGMGKSRLLLEFQRGLETSEEPPLVLRGHNLPAGHGSSLWALGEILRRAHNIALDEPPSAAADKLVAGARGTLEVRELSGDDLERALHALALSGGFVLERSVLERVPPREVAQEMALAWARYLSASAARRPTVVVLEDLHWANEQLLGLLRDAVARATGPLLVVASARPGLAPAEHLLEAGGRRPTLIALGPLDGARTRELVDELLAGVELPAEARDEIVAKAEGNPFFIREIVHRLRDEGIRPASERAPGSDGARLPIRIPETVHALLAARIDALGATEKRVLQDAAVVGRVFWDGAVASAAVAGCLAGTLDALANKGLIVREEVSSLSGHREYTFAHALVRDVAYEGVPKAQRGRAHARVAQWLSELARERSEDLDELRANHLYLAVEGDNADLAWAEDPEGRREARARAFDALMLAGDRARRRFAIAHALEKHEQALAVAADPAAEGAALEALGDDHAALFHGDQANAFYVRARERLAAGADDEAGAVRIPLKMASNAVRPGAFETMPEPREIHDLIERGLVATRDDDTRARFLTARGACAWLWEQAGVEDPLAPDVRLSSLQEACRIAEARDDPEQLDLARNWLVRTSWSFERVGEALATVTAHLPVLDKVASRGDRADFLSAAADVTTYLGADPARGCSLAERAVELAADTSPHQVMHTTRPLMEAAFYSGRWRDVDAALEAHLAALAFEPHVGCPYVRGGPLFGAMVLAHRGDADAARRAASLTLEEPRPFVVTPLYAWYLAVVGETDQARELARSWLERSSSRTRPDGRVAIVEVLAALGEWDGVLAWERSAERSGGTTLVDPFVERALGWARAAAGNADDARARLHAALDGFEARGMPFEVARTCEALALLVSTPERETLIRRAHEGYAALGAVPPRR